MQLDAEEDENVFYKPPVEPAARSTGEPTADSKAAATVTAEDDDEDDD
jgi:sorting nexin-1/2